MGGGGDLTEYFNGLPEDSQGEFPNSPAVLTAAIPETPTVAVEKNSASATEDLATTTWKLTPPKQTGWAVNNLPKHCTKKPWKT